MILAIVFIISIWCLWYNYQARKNPYIKIHGLKLKNDKAYSKYLKWCAKKGEAPMDKIHPVKSISEKESKINNLL